MWLGSVMSGLLHGAIALSLLGLATGVLRGAGPALQVMEVQIVAADQAPADVDVAADAADAAAPSAADGARPAETPVAAAVPAPATSQPAAPAGAARAQATTATPRSPARVVPYLQRPLRAGDAMTARSVRKSEPRLNREDSLLRRAQPLDTPATRRTAMRYRAAAAQGHAFARYNFARVLAAGRGVDRDITTAAAEFLAAARQGYVPAMLRLAELSLAGEGVARDEIAAARWYYLAAALDNEGGRRGRSLVAARLDIAQRDNARKQAVELRGQMPPVDIATRRRQESSFMHAASAGDIEAVRRLLAEGVDANVVDELGRTGLINAAWRGHTDIVELLAGAGVDVDATDDDGRTGLMWSAINGHPVTLKRLLAFDAYVDAVDGRGMTPLMRAAWNGHADAVRSLLARGADPRLRDHAGMTALDRARAQDEQEIIAMLLQALTG